MTKIKVSKWADQVRKEKEGNRTDWDSKKCADRIGIVIDVYHHGT